MPNLKKSLSPATLITAILTFLLFLPDLDTFTFKFSVAPPLLNLLAPIDEFRFSVVFGKAACVLLAILSLFCASSCLRNSRLKLLCLGSAGLVLYSWLLLVINGLPIADLMSVQSLVGIYLMTLSAFVTCGFAKDGRVLLGVGLGVLGAGGIRLLYAIYCYRRYGGVQIFENTPALAMDGGLLVIWAVLAVGAGVYALQLFHERQLGSSFLMLVMTMIFAAPVAASFRRTAMLLLLLNLCLAAVIYSWFRNRLAAGILWVGGMSMVALVGLFLVMSAVFGVATATERVFSVTSSSVNAANSFGNSNAFYEDDQRALLETLKNSSFIGVGPGMPYGVSRMTDAETEDEGIVPLHTGMSELWASSGVVGMIYHLVFMIGLPISWLRAYRQHQDGSTKALVALAGSYVLFTVLWPFAPPFYINTQWSIIMGLCLGYLIHAASQASLVAEQKRGPAANSYPRPAPMAA